MKCVVCSTQTGNPKFCSTRCRQKDWRSKKKSIDELVTTINAAIEHEKEELENKNMIEILIYLYGDKRRAVPVDNKWALV